MINQTESLSASQHTINQFGSRVTQHLDDALQSLPRDIGERLRASRVQALASRRLSEAPHAHSTVHQGGAVLLQGGFGAWGRMASVLPLLALTVGLFGIGNFQEQLRVSEIADVDAELLTGDLPPSAYTDPGFAQYLKLDRKN
jgi:Protein of unknown function (DUF3619)